MIFDQTCSSENITESCAITCVFYIVTKREKESTSFPCSMSLWDNMQKAIRNAIGSYLKIKPQQTPC